MEKGEMRVEANISVKKSVSRTLLKDAPRRALDNLLGGNLGTKVEVKNLNSFRAAERAIEYEFERQVALLEAGEKVEQETRGWNEAKGETFSQRKKETSQDYRYFPEPDLPKLFISQIPEFQNLKSTLPELPWAKRERLQKLGFLQAQDVEQLVNDFELTKLFEAVEKILIEPELIKIAANFVLNDVVGQRRKDPTWAFPTATHLAEVTKSFKESVMSSPQAKQAIITGKMVATVDDSTLPAIVEKIIAENAKSVEDFKSGKAVALQFLIGQGMKASKGAANPKVLETLFKKALPTGRQALL